MGGRKTGWQPARSGLLRQVGLWGAVCVSAQACHAPPPPPPAATLRVAALSQPAAWLVSQVGGDGVEVRLVPPPGADPPAWTPPPEVIAGLRSVDLIAAAGAGYEAWTAMATLPDDRMFAMADGIEPIVLSGTSHSHGGQVEHAHTGVDPHVWTDPTQVAVAARRLADRLVALAPDRAAGFRARAEAVQRVASELDLALATAAQPLQRRPMFTNHPSFNYLARRYHLTVDTIELDPASLPSPPQRARVEVWLREEVGGRSRADSQPLLLWEAPPHAEVLSSLPSRLQHAVLDPAEQPGPSGSYDWAASMRRTAEALSQSVR